MSIRGLRAALNDNGRYLYKSPESVVDYLVIGGGVVGLAVARRLAQQFPHKSTFLVERHTSAGQEISGRNSEVVHAGLYYPNDSLKTRLCLRGRTLLYDYCAKNNVPHRKTGKLVVAQEQQRSYIETLHNKAKNLVWPPHSSSDNTRAPVVPVRLLDRDETHQMEPNLSKKIVAALFSPETGIIDSHTLMEAFEKDISETEGGAVAYATKVVRVDPHIGSPRAEGSVSAEVAEPGWIVQTVTGNAAESDSLLARTIINALGLAGSMVLNSLLPPAKRIPMYFAKGSYASYHGRGVSDVKHLIYPCPGTGRTLHGFQSLGTHLTLDLQGNARFGPDIDWLSPPENADVDFWTQHLIPDESRIGEISEAVREYLEDIDTAGLQPDYCGIRPKLVGPDGGFQDFVFRTDYPHDFCSKPARLDATRDGTSPMITLMGIESPGLTSSLAIAELVVEDMLRGKEGHA
ncbi:NAD dehydrogenase [Irpex rosettiformis]|uniref:NAD dehydrogenase n=1 Tax=Irpex rosettiformis TaxID=378272 RepID=A0ACB8UC53_9APHY|nr:NAD dehydrogenase [Irpex rosettiformis]